MSLDDFARGYAFQKELFSLFERLQREIDPSWVFAYPHLQQRLDYFLDRFEENYVFSWGGFSYALMHPMKTLELRRVVKDLRKAYVKRSS